MKHFIGLFTTLTPDFSGDYIPSLLFSAKRVPTLINLRHVHLKTAKYLFYQDINYVLKNTPCSLIRLDRLLSAEFVTSRQKFDTPGKYGAHHDSSASTTIPYRSGIILAPCNHRTATTATLLSFQGSRAGLFCALPPVTIERSPWFL